MDQQPAQKQSFFSDPLLRTRILIIGLVLVVALLLIAALSMSSNPSNTATPQPTGTAQTPSQPAGNAVLSLSPASLSVGSSGSINVTIDSPTDPVSSIQIELSYDPTALQNVNISVPTTNGFLQNPIILDKKINPTTGRISYLLGQNPNETPPSGKGTVAVLTFQTLKGSGQTTISFSPKSLVTAPGVDNSILKTTSEAIITLTGGNPNQASPSSTTTQ